MTNSEILDGIVAELANGNYAEFARMIGEKYSTVTSWKSRNKFPAHIIYAKCVGINPEYVMNGKLPILLPQDSKTEPLKKITIATNELLIVCNELKKQVTDIRQELEEERRQHRETVALLNRVLDLYTQRLDTDYVRMAKDQYKTLAAEAETNEAV